MSNADTSDDVLAALDEAARSIDDIASAHAEVTARANELRRARQSGRGWPEIIGVDRHRALVGRLNQLVTRATEGVSRLRRALIVALRAEGFTVEQIARQFGVSHQRISSVLRTRDKRARAAGPAEPAAEPGAVVEPDHAGAGGAEAMAADF